MKTAVTGPGSGTDRPTGAARPAHRLPFRVDQRLGLLVLVVVLSALFGLLRPAFVVWNITVGRQGRAPSTGAP